MTRQAKYLIHWMALTAVVVPTHCFADPATDWVNSVYKITKDHANHVLMKQASLLQTEKDKRDPSSGDFAHPQGVPQYANYEVALKRRFAKGITAQPVLKGTEPSGKTWDCTLAGAAPKAGALSDAELKQTVCLAKVTQRISNAEVKARGELKAKYRRNEILPADIQSAHDQIMESLDRERTINENFLAHLEIVRSAKSRQARYSGTPSRKVASD